jgi:PAS domain-containing protein
MKDVTKTKGQLREELAMAHQLNAELKNSASEHKRIEEAIKGSEERYRKLVENAHDVLWVFDLNLGVCRTQVCFFRSECDLNPIQIGF